MVEKDIGAAVAEELFEGIGACSLTGSAGAGASLQAGRFAFE